MDAILTQTKLPPKTKSAMPVDPEWYRNAVIYQMHVRSFSDSNGDGIGDFQGVISKLDYLEQLGVTAIWLLPFYPSPLRDDGYDIADYTSVNPMYGNIDDAREFIAEAHKRQIRVITELVINHTSDQHAWFQRARKAPKGSPERDFYVWSDTPTKYDGVRIIFKDFEPSNWTFDHVAGQYYWHRFFNHQPDLNFDNPAVHEAVLTVCDFWMAAGVDGVRLDAVPYLYEREGTSCENLQETHDYLKSLRRHIDTNWPGRMLLAEANQWPEDAIAYFGDKGDECHMNFHFPLMPRLFMSLRMEDRYPIIDILEQTPPLPPGAQWAMFLRNHDELTLEMVTDEERDYMWRVYASNPTARINMGIRRRLAPLLDNNRRKIELMNALLFSMPGTPVVYYGDEIGMGDNIYLGDRNGVRTPMQWSADRNAGFSRANPQQLFLPAIIDPEYNFEAINVEAQMANPSSLLGWMRRLIALRKNHPVLGKGEIKFLTPSNAKVLAFVRDDGNERILVVANLSRFAQPVELDLVELAGVTPVEMFGNTRFPTIAADGKYTLAVGPHAFYYFLLEAASTGTGSNDAPEIQVSLAGETLLDDPSFAKAFARRLPRLLPTKRWFVSKAKTIRAVSILDRLPVGDASEDTSPNTVQRRIFLINVEFNEGEPELYAMPLTATVAEAWTPTPAAEAGVLLQALDGSGSRWIVQDGMTDADFARALLDVALNERDVDGHRLQLAGRRIGELAVDPATLVPKVSDKEQSNSNVVFGESLILKLYRRIGDGENPELEIGEHLTTKSKFANTAPLAGTVELAVRGSRATPQTLAVVLNYVPNQGDAWGVFLDYALRFFEGLDALTPEQAASLCLPGETGCPSGPDAGPPTNIAELIAEPLQLTRLLGERTAEMHAALADDAGDNAFTIEPYSAVYQRGLLQSMRNTSKATFETLARRASALTGTAFEMAKELGAREADVLRAFRELTSRPIRSPRIRIHGDYHLGQVLWTGKDFVIIDFEGEPLRSVGERRLKKSPFRDVAGMFRSFDYAAWTALRRHEQMLPSENNAPGKERDTRGALIWSTWLGHEFVRAYCARLRDVRPDLLPPDPMDVEVVLRSWVLEKALYEVRYELNSRPDWVDIPLRAVLAILGTTTMKTGGEQTTASAESIQASDAIVHAAAAAATAEPATTTAKEGA